MGMMLMSFCYSVAQDSLPFEMPVVEEPSFSSRTVNIMDFGAVGDGTKVNTDAIENAINDCSSKGGGTVIIPAGLWITGPIEMKSNINLRAERGALVCFSKNHDDYMPDGKDGAVMSPISGKDLTNIAFTGEGVYDGGGDTWRPAKRGKYTDGQWKEMIANGGMVDDKGLLWPKGTDGKKDVRPNMVVLNRCTKVLFDGPTFQNSPKFVIVPRYCEHLTMRNLKVLNEWSAQNGDGIDLSGGKNIMITNCMLNVGDDGICMKSSGKKGNTAALQNVVITNCVVYHAHGGFVIGSNTDGGMHNIYVNNCNFMYTDVGLRFKSARDRGGLVDNIFINNIYMKDIANEAILFDTYYGGHASNEQTVTVSVTDKTPHFCKFKFKHIYCNGAKQAIKIIGLPEMPIEDISFNDVSISSEKGIIRQNDKNIEMNHVVISTTKE